MVTNSLPEILLCLLLLVRPLGAAAATSALRAPSQSPSAKATSPLTSASDAVPGAAPGASDDDDDDDDDDDSTPSADGASAATAHAPQAKEKADAKKDSDADDDDDDDDLDYDDAVDIASDAEDSGKAISGNVTIASDYILRGLTQTDHQPAIQGGFDWTHPSGVYAGVWGSNVHFIGELPSIELDPYAGYAYHITKDLKVSLGIDYLAYFQDEGRDSWDFPARIEWKTFSLEVDYSPRWAGLGGDSWYFLGGWSDTLWWDFTFGAYVGFSTFSADADAPDYWDFRVTVSHKFLQVDWGLAGVFVSNQEINDANGGARAIFSASKSF